MGIESNRTLLEKADLALSDLTSGGQLRPAQADEFIRLAIKQSVFMGGVTVRPMAAFQEDIDKLRFASRVLKPGVEATALPVGSRVKPDLGRVQLSAKLFRAESRMSYEVLEDQIERSAFQNTVMQSLSAAVARDIETVVINGDTASANALLASLDGVLKQATSNTVDNLNARLTKNTLRDVTKALDDEFANEPDLKFWTNRQARLDLKDSYAERATMLGDASLVQGGSVSYDDRPVIAVPEFPPTAETGGSNTQVLFTTGRNVVVGILRNIRVEMDKDISAGVIVIAVSLRFDTRIIETAAAAKAINVLGT